MAILPERDCLVFNGTATCSSCGETGEVLLVGPLDSRSLRMFSAVAGAITEKHEDGPRCPRCDSADIAVSESTTTRRAGP